MKLPEGYQRQQRIISELRLLLLTQIENFVESKNGEVTVNEVNHVLASMLSRNIEHELKEELNNE